MKIMYVEDNQVNVYLVKRVARMGQHEIVNYIDGADALRNFDQDKPALVLMDIQLAGELTGLEVVAKLRERGYKTPIVAVTAYAMVGDRERCLEAGCDDYLPKPLTISHLVELFSRYAADLGKSLKDEAAVAVSDEKPTPPQVAPQQVAPPQVVSNPQSPTPAEADTPADTEAGVKTDTLLLGGSV